MGDAEPNDVERALEATWIAMVTALLHDEWDMAKEFAHNGSDCNSCLALLASSRLVAMLVANGADVARDRWAAALLANAQSDDDR